MAVDYSPAALATAAGIDPWSLAGLVRSGDAATLQEAALRVRRLGVMAAEAVADGDRADRRLAAAFGNDGLTVFDAATSTRRGAQLLADGGEKIEEAARALLDVATALAEVRSGTTSRVSGLDAELNRIIAARNAAVASGPDAAAAEQRFSRMAVDAVHRTGTQVQADLQAYEAVLDNRAARLGGGAGPADVTAVVVLPAPPVPPVAVADVILTVIALLLAAIASGSGDQPDPPGPETTPAGQPVYEKGALGDRYQPGVHDEEGIFTFPERRIADRIIEEDPGARIDPRPADHSTTGKQNPDAILRRSPDDPGTIIELKTLKPGSKDVTNTINQDIGDSRTQLRPYGGGDVYIDGQEAGVTAEEAERGYRRAEGNARAHGSELPGVVVILGDGTLYRPGAG